MARTCEALLTQRHFLDREQVEREMRVGRFPPNCPPSPRREMHAIPEKRTRRQKTIREQPSTHCLMPPLPPATAKLSIGSEETRQQLIKSAPQHCTDEKEHSGRLPRASVTQSPSSFLLSDGVRDRRPAMRESWHQSSNSASVGERGAVV